MHQLIRRVISYSVFFIVVIVPSVTLAQNEVPRDSTTGVFMRRGVYKDTSYQNYASGEFTPGRGFDMARTKFGTLNISLYAIARYLNQLPGQQTWNDHLGRERQ